MPTSRLITAITAALQAKVNVFWTAQGFPGSPPTLSDIEGAMSAIYDTILPDVIQPLSGAPSGNVTYNTIPVGPQIYRILIPAAYLVAASGGPWTLTLGTGSGTTIAVPIAPHGVTITSGALLFSVYVDGSGNVTSDSWQISGYNSGIGFFEYYSDGTLKQWDATANSYALAAPQQTFSSNFPVPFNIAPAASFMIGWPDTSWAGLFVQAGSVNASGLQVMISNTNAQHSAGYAWTALGTWR